MARSTAYPSSFLAVAALLLCARVGAPAEVLVEVEGQGFNVGALGEEPGGAGADVSNALRLEGLAPALSLGLDLGPTRRVELRLRRLRDDNVYATVHTDLLVLNGEQRVARDSLDALLAQKLGGTPFRLELGYRYLDLERSWEDAIGSGGDLRTLDYSSDVRGHGVRMALGLDLRFLGRVHLDTALGWSLLAGQESRRVHYTDTSEYAQDQPDRASDGSRNISMSDVLFRLRVRVTSRVWLAVGYRYETWYSGGDSSEFSDSGPTFNVGLRLGGPR
jgi:hypothetical protein